MLLLALFCLARIVLAMPVYGSSIVIHSPTSATRVTVASGADVQFSVTWDVTDHPDFNAADGVVLKVALDSPQLNGRFMYSMSAFGGWEGSKSYNGTISAPSQEGIYDFTVYLYSCKPGCTSDPMLCKDKLLLSTTQAGAVQVGTPSHTVDTPAAPIGPTTASVGEEVVFSTPVSTCSQGHPLHYQFEFGDEGSSGWSTTANATHSFQTERMHRVRVRVSCQWNPSDWIMSDWSAPALIKIGTDNPPQRVQHVGSCAAQDQAWGIAVSGSYGYLADREGGLQIVNVSDPTNPTIVGAINSESWEGWACDVSINGDYAYVAHGDGGLRVIDVSTPSNPIEVGSCPASEWIQKVCVAGNYLYTADFPNGVIDISAPSNPHLVEQGPSGSSADALAIQGRYLYTVDWSGSLSVFDISNPTNPVMVGQKHVANDTKGIVVTDGYAYIAAGDEGLVIVDMKNPSSLVKTGQCLLPGYAEDVAVSGLYAYVAAGVAGIRVVDISDMYHLQEAGSYDTRDYAKDVTIDGQYIYVADGVDGLVILQFLNSGSSASKRPDTKIESAEVDAAKGIAKFTWTGSDDTTPVEDLVYSYRLVRPGLKYDDWSSWSKDTTWTYPRLISGSYKFEVRARDGDGGIDGSPASKEFSINIAPVQYCLGTGVHPKEGTTETDFYYTVIICGGYGSKPSLVSVSIDGKDYPMQFRYEDAVGLHYRYGPVNLPVGEHQYSFHFCTENEDYWYPGFEEANTGPTIVCAQLPARLIEEANELKRTLVGNKLGGTEKDGGLLDRAAIGTAERTAAFAVDIGQPAFVQYVKQVLNIPSDYDRFKKLQLTYKEGLVYELNGLITAVRQWKPVSQQLQPYLEELYRKQWSDSAEQQIADFHDDFLATKLCASEESVSIARDFLQDGQNASSSVFDQLVDVPFAGYDFLAQVKTGVTYLQVAAVAGGAVLGLLSMGGGLAVGVSAAEGFESVKLSLSLAQAIVVGMIWGGAPTFASVATSVAGRSYNLAGQAVETGERTYPKLEFVSLNTPPLIRFGETKPAEALLWNRSDLPVKAQLYVEIETPILHVAPFVITFPAGEEVEIKAGKGKTFTFPIFCPPIQLFDATSWMLPTKLKVSCYVTYGYLAPYGRRIDLGYMNDVPVELPEVSLVKDVYAHVGKLVGLQTAVGQEDTDANRTAFDVVLTVSNHTEDIVDDIVVKDYVPDDLRPFVIVFKTSSDETSYSGDELTWTLSLKSEERRYLRYTVFTTQANEGEVYGIPRAEVQFINEEGNTQTVQSAGTIDEVCKQQVQIKRMASLPRSPQVDEEFKVEAKIENPGPDTLNNVIVSIRLPRGLDCVGEISKVIESIPTGGAATVEWDVKALESRVFNIGVEVQAFGYAGDLQIFQIRIRNPGENPPPSYYISLSPNPVPSGGCVFWLNLPENIAQAKLMIFNVAGQPVFETSLDVNSTRFPSAGTWNPVGRDGVPLANGPYVYVLIADGKVIGQGKMVIQR